jgi:hypothetical protein
VQIAPDRGALHLNEGRKQIVAVMRLPPTNPIISKLFFAIMTLGILSNAN